MTASADGAAPGKPGLYIHVPFCRVRCPFCTFAITTRTDQTDGWLRALEMEMRLRALSWRETFDTVYLGGGTPSLLGPERVDRLLRAVRLHFTIESGAEVTLEANPGDLEEGDYTRLLEAGVSRLSLGIQSLDDRDLVFLGRDHDAAAATRSFRQARREGFTNITVDLLYGLPGRSRQRWEEQLRGAVELEPDHISAYLLSLERGTPLARRRERGEFEGLSEAASQEIFLFTRDWLQVAGYRQYEVSSFARAAAFRSRHNRKYWQGVPYLGLGPAAHSYRHPERSWNMPQVGQYISRLGSGKLAIAGSETLTPEDHRLEVLFLGLRTTRGISLSAFNAEFGADLRATHGEVIGQLLEEELAALEEDRFRLTPAGLALADAVAARLAGTPAGC